MTSRHASTNLVSRHYTQIRHFIPLFRGRQLSASQFSRVLGTGLTFLALAAALAGCGGQRADYSSTVSQYTVRVAKQSIRAMNDQPRITAVAVGHDRRRRTFVAIVKAQAGVIDNGGNILGCCTFYGVGHVTKAGKLRLHIDWSRSHTDN